MLLNPLFRVWDTALPTGIRSLYTASILEGARKGTRMKADAKKKAIKKEIVKKEFIPLKKRLEMEKVGKISPRLDDSGRGYPVDDVFFKGAYKWINHSVDEAVQMHRESQHPTQLNNPNADILAYIELSMAANKINQYIDTFSDVLLLPHTFDANYERSILAICKDEQMELTMREMGVCLAIGPQIVKMVEKGNFDFKLYDHIVCHSFLLPNLISIRSALKRQFPTPRNGTAGPDLVPLVERFLKGVKYEFVKDKYDHDFASVEVKIGTLQMESAQLDDNLRALIRDVEAHRPKTRSADLITLVNLTCGSGRERFKIDHTLFLQSEVEQDEGFVTKTT